MTDGRRFLRAGLAAALVLATFAAWLVADPGTHWTDRVVSDLSFVVFPLAAAASCFRAARRGGPSARGWRFMAMGASTWALGGVVWCFYELVLHRFSPFPSPADIGFVGYSVPVAIGLFLFPGGSTRLVSRFRALLDGAAMASAVLFVSWVVVLGPLYRAGGEGPLSRVVGLAYPITDVVMVSLVLALGLRRRSGGRLPWLVLGAGLLFLATTDSTYVLQVLRGGYTPGGILDLGWAAAFVVMALSAFAPTTSDDDMGHHAEPRLSLVLELVPYFCLLGGVVVAVQLDGDFVHDPFLLANGMVVLALYGIRQVVMLKESISLTDDLERTVDRRTGELRSQEQWFRSLVQHSSDITVVVGADGRLRYHSPSTQTVLGYRPEEVPTDAAELVHPADRPQVLSFLSELEAPGSASTSLEFRVRHRDGAWHHVDAVGTSLLRNEDVGGIVLNLRDVTERKRLEDDLRRQAFYDALTGLANRALFQDRLAKAVEVARRRGAAPAVLVVDLDGFKEVNDTLGHLAGDRLLVAMGERLQGCLRPEDTAARLGGDEYAVLLEQTSSSGARTVAERIIAVCRQPCSLEEREILPHASVGIAAWTPDIEQTDTLMQRADTAMYAAKAMGGNRLEVFEAATHAAVLGRLELAVELRGCVERRELELHYQPIVATDSGRTVGFEALVRWRHPQRGLIAPDHFIPVAEKTGAIMAIGRWVLETACRQALEWQHRWPCDPPLYVSVNLSTRELREAGIVGQVDRVLSESGLDPACLVLEITETSLVSDFEETIGNLHRLKELGVKLSMDDFGTGYSSLTYLRRLPVDFVKIDRSFVSGIATSAEEWSLAVAIVKLVRALSLSTVAEGVEGAAQLAHLRALGCDFAQGYYFAKPQPARAIEEMLSRLAEGRLLHTVA